MPTVVASIATPATLPSAMGMTVTGWGTGYLAGAPIVSIDMPIFAGTRTNKSVSLTVQAGFLLGKPSAKL